MCRLVLVFGASAALVVFGTAMQAAPQEKKPETPAAQPVPAAATQERAELGPVLDTWYRIETGRAAESLHVGFSRELVRRQPPGTNWQYEYESDSEMDLMVPDPKEKPKDGVAPKKVSLFESIQFRDVRLDDTFAPSLLTRVDDRNGVQTTTNVSLAEGVRTIRILVTPNEFKDHKVNPDEEIYYSRFLMFLALRQNNSLSKPGARKAMLLHPREDGTSAITEVQFQIGEMVKREYLGKKEVSVTPIVFIKPPLATNREYEILEVYVDRFGRTLEEVARNGLRRLIVKDKAEAVPKSLMVRLQGRRDPFDKRGPLGGVGPATKDGGPAGGVGEVSPSMFEATLGKAKLVLDDLRKAKDEGRETDGDETYSKVIAYYTALRKSLEVQDQPANLKGQMEEIRRRAEEIWGGVTKLVNRAGQVWARAIEGYKRDQTEEIEKGIRDLKEIETNPILAGQAEQQKKVMDWIADLGPKLNACKTRIELAKKKIVLSGTTLAEEPILISVDVTVNVLGHQVGDTQLVKFIKPVRMAILNDKSYRIGDLVEGEGVRVEKIWAHGVQISLKDETREIGIRQ
jgi:hypothetical protein